MTEANNALSTTSHLPNLDEAADPGAPKPTHKLDVNSVILTLIPLVVTYNATRNSAQTYHQNITTTGGRTDEYTKPRYAQSYTDPEDRIFKKLFFGNVKEIGYREKESFGICIYPSSTQGTYAAPFIALLGCIGNWPYSVNIMATFELQGIEYEWKWYATDVAHAMAIAGLTQRVHGRTDPNADEDHDFTPLLSAEDGSQLIQS